LCSLSPFLDGSISPKENTKTKKWYRRQREEKEGGTYLK